MEEVADYVRPKLFGRPDIATPLNPVPRLFFRGG